MHAAVTRFINAEKYSYFLPSLILPKKPNVCAEYTTNSGFYQTTHRNAKESGSSKTLSEDNVTGLLLSYKLNTCKRKRTYKYVTTQRVLHLHQFEGFWTRKIQMPCTNLTECYKTRKPCCRRKPRDAAAVLFGLKFADNIHYKFKSSQASKAMLQLELQTYRRKQNIT